MSKPKIFTVVGPSGVGKTTLSRTLAKVTPVEEIVSTTSRPCRTGETGGVDYNFISLEQAKKYIEEDAYLEYAEYHGNIYGNLKSDFEDPMEEGLDLIIVVERHGLAQLKAAYPEQVVSILVKPPSIEELERRLRQAGRDPDEIERRLTSVEEELDEDGFDYVLVNGDFQDAMNDLFEIYQTEATDLPSVEFTPKHFEVRNAILSGKVTETGP